MYPSMASNPRKRPAPGTSPAMPVNPMQQNNRYPSPSSGDMMRWQDPSGSNTAGGMGDPSAYLTGGGNTQALNPYGMMPAQPPQQQHQYAAQVPTPSPNTALARRQTNRALVSTNPRPNFDASPTDPWASFLPDDSSSLQQHQNQQSDGTTAVAEADSVEALEERALKAKREAQAKRKQIPPFVQKLSSFLDQEKNVDLIRWSDKGDSFIVIDEDEFARTLIPELFKHNNYASFVRQLNMYGFHKQVGLSDNSMRASERKNKSPSEYSNPYFRRGHPNLLWLINKPSGKAGAGGKNTISGKKNQNPNATNKAATEADPDSDEEIQIDEPPLPERLGHVGGPVGGATPRALPPSSGEMPLQQKEISAIRNELTKLSNQQGMILNALTRLQRENNNLYQQAAVFQEQHERHQNSINAILNFLANVFRKTLEDQNGSQNVNELLASIIPGNNAGGATMPSGSIVDLGDFVQSQAADPSMGQHKRTRLLPPVPEPNLTKASPASTAETMPSSSADSKPYSNYRNREQGTVTELLDTPDSNAAPDSLAQELKSNPQEQMMRIIQDTNANNPGIHVPDVVANTPKTMSNDQRQQMLNSMMAQSSSSNSGTIPATAPAQQSSADVTRDPNLANFSLSPVIGSNPQPPDMNQISQNNAQFDQLRRMSEDNNASISRLQNMLVPLSPSGRFPAGDDGSGDLANSYFGSGSPGDIDFDNLLNSNAYDQNNASDIANLDLYNGTGDFDFGLLNDDGVGPAASAADGADVNAIAGGVAANVAAAEAPAANGTPSSTATEEIPRDDVTASPRDSKRRRVG